MLFSAHRRLFFTRSLVCAIAFSSVAVPAFADPSPGEIQAARELFSKAEKDEDGGNWSAALDKLRRAASVKLTPGIRYHIALCEERLGQLAAALNDYSGAESTARETHNKEVLDIVAEPIRNLRARVPTLSIDVPTDIPGLEVTLDGKPFPLGLSGIATPLDPGVHQVEAHAPDKNPFSATLTLKERDAAQLNVRLTDPPKKRPIQETIETKDTTSAAAQAALELPPEEPPKASHAAAIGTTVTAAVLVGAGVAAFLIADGSAANARTACLTEPVPAPCTINQSAIRGWDAAALTSWSLAGVFAIVSIVLWTRPSPTAPVENARLVVRPEGITFLGNF